MKIVQSHENINEETTRKEIIDLRLKEQGWTVNNKKLVLEEIDTKNSDFKITKYLDYNDTFPIQTNEILQLKFKVKTGKLNEKEKLSKAYVDYLLLDDKGKPLAVVEAKRVPSDLAKAKKSLISEARDQAYNYAKDIFNQTGEKVFIYFTNGKEIYFAEDFTQYERKIYGFHSQEDLIRRRYLKENKVGVLSKMSDPQEKIVDRERSINNVQAILESFDEGRKEALINMATGTGKTRVAMALIDFLRRGKRVDKVLFLTDRIALREQVYKKGFMKFFPNKAILEIKEKDDKVNYKHGLELYTATIPTIVNLYNRRDKKGKFEMSVGEFDLIIIDEAHRSIFNKYKHMLEYFDAYKIGLTATPANFIDRNSYQFFKCPNNKPTVVYDFYEAVNENVLVDFRRHVMKYETERQKEGFNLDNITEEERYEIEKKLAEKGIYDIEEFNFEGKDLERKVVNEETTQLQVSEFMNELQKDKNGEICKTIVFAMNIPHAERIYKEIKELYPNKPGLADIIVTGGKSKNTQKQIEKFESKSYPRIAVSVGILDTGVDVPEVCNLVFMKPISSTIRLWQMIGRGSRCESACEHPEWLPEGGKKYFVIYDFLHNFDDWGNLKDDDKEKPVHPLVRIFNYRVDLLNHYIKSKDNKKVDYFKKIIHKEIEEIPKDLPKVKENATIINKALDSFFWKNSAINQIEYLKKEISPFMELKSVGDPLRLSFKREIEKSMILSLSKDKEEYFKSKEKLKHTINKIYDCISLPVVAQKKELEKTLTQDFWESYDFEKSRFLLNEILPISNLQRSTRVQPLIINVSDNMKIKEQIVLDGGEFKDTQVYKEEIKKKIFELAKFNPVIHKIMNDEPLFEADIEYLENTFKKELNLTDSVVRQFYTGNLISLIRLFLKNKDLGSEQEELHVKFKEFRENHKKDFNQTQLKFLDMIEKKFLMERKIEESDLYSGQFETIAGGIDNVFTQTQISDILSFYNKLK